VLSLWPLSASKGRSMVAVHVEETVLAGLAGRVAAGWRACLH
jgi:hypothetical protein